MKKIIIVAASIAASQEQPAHVGFTPLAEQQQQAKSGVVEDIDGNSTVVRAIADVDPLRATAGGVMVEALRAASEETFAWAVIKEDEAVRSVTLAETGNAAALAGVGVGASGAVLAATLTFDGGALKNAPMTNAIADGTGISTLINAAIGATKPAFSITTIVNKIEDILLDIDDGTSAVVVVDQVNNRVRVYSGTEAQITAYTALLGAQVSAGAMADFTVDTTPAATTEGAFGE